METKHTPGPWSYWSGYNPFDKIEAQVTAEGGDIVIASYNHLIAEGEANAKLMAMSPQLLLALVDALTIFRGLVDVLPVVRERVEAYDNLIAKATAQPQTLEIAMTSKSDYRSSTHAFLSNDGNLLRDERRYDMVQRSRSLHAANRTQP